METLILFLAVLGAMSAGFFICLFITCTVLLWRWSRHENNIHRHRDVFK